MYVHTLLYNVCQFSFILLLCIESTIFWWNTVKFTYVQLYRHAAAVNNDITTRITIATRTVLSCRPWLPEDRGVGSFNSVEKPDSGLDSFWTGVNSPCIGAHVKYLHKHNHRKYNTSSFSSLPELGASICRRRLVAFGHVRCLPEATVH